MSTIVDEATLIVAPKPVREAMKVTQNWVTDYKLTHGRGPNARATYMRLLFTLVAYGASTADIRWMVDAGYLLREALELWEAIR